MVTMAKILLDAGALVDNVYNVPALEYAVLGDSNQELVNLLLARGADPTRLTDYAMAEFVKLGLGKTSLRPCRL